VLLEVVRDYLPGISELDLNILLLDAWKFSMKLVSVGNLLYIELEAKGLQVRAVMTTSSDVATRVLIEVIEETEEGNQPRIDHLSNNHLSNNYPSNSHPRNNHLRLNHSRNNYPRINRSRNSHMRNNRPRTKWALRST
jgi:hypothetical protein